MEQLNKVELRGYVGAVRIFKVGNKDIAKFSVATAMAYRGLDGSIIEETTWHNVTASESSDCVNLSKLQKGCFVQIIGRLRNVRYEATDGLNRYMTEIIVRQLNVIED